jgi:hypothetical protein
VVHTPAEEVNRKVSLVKIPAEANEDRLRRLANQRLFPQYYVKCSCEQGCYECAYTGLVSKGHPTHTRPT